jgi:hypothetical protein
MLQVEVLVEELVVELSLLEVLHQEAGNLIAVVVFW